MPGVPRKVLDEDEEGPLPGEQKFDGMVHGVTLDAEEAMRMMRRGTGSMDGTGGTWQHAQRRRRS